MSPKKAGEEKKEEMQYKESASVWGALNLTTSFGASKS